MAEGFDCTTGKLVAIAADDPVLSPGPPPPAQPAPTPAVGDVVEHAGAKAIVTAVNAAAGTVDVSALPAPTTVPAIDVTPT